MKDFPKDSGNLSDSSIFKARIREADLTSQEKLQEIQGAADELARQTIINKLKQAEVEHEKLKLKLEQEASGRINNILSYVELNAAENEDNFTSGIDDLLAKLFKFFNFMDSELGVETDPQVYSMIKELEKKQVWIAAVIKFLRNKFNKLIKAIFSRDLSFQQKIDQEIERLFKRLFENDLSQEEEAAILERLEALRDLKLKLQIFVVGSVIAMFAELFSVELTASMETTKEEGRNAEKTSAKEATKEVRENLEIKVDAKEKPQLKYDVIPALNAESWLKKPITLNKQEHDLLPKSLKDILPPVHKDDMNKGNSGELKPGVKEKQGNENKKPTQPPQKPNVAVPPKKEPGKVSRMKFYSEGTRISIGYGRNSGKGVNSINEKKANNKYSATSNFNGKGSRSTGGHEADNLDTKLREKAAQREYAETSGRHETGDLDAKLVAKVAERNARKKCAEAFTKHDYPINTWVPSEITDVGINNVKDQSVGRNDKKTVMSQG